jgi:hypothetical protein
MEIKSNEGPAVEFDDISMGDGLPERKMSCMLLFFIDSSLIGIEGGDDADVEELTFVEGCRRPRLAFPVGRL